MKKLLLNIFNNYLMIANNMYVTILNSICVLTFKCLTTEMIHLQYCKFFSFEMPH